MITFTPPSADISIGIHNCIRLMISYKYPIFPSKITQLKLAENLDACRWLYNRGSSLFCMGKLESLVLCVSVPLW